jgi:hypothetical protein
MQKFFVTSPTVQLLCYPTQIPIWVFTVQRTTISVRLDHGDAGKDQPAVVKDYSKGRASLEEFGPNTAFHPNPVIPASTSISEVAHQNRSLFGCMPALPALAETGKIELGVSGADRRFGKT